MRVPWLCLAVGCQLLIVFATRAEPSDPPEEWNTQSPRDEIRPAFSYDVHGGPEGGASFGIAADNREGLDGAWVRTFPVEGGKHYGFSVLRKVEGVAAPRRSAVVKITWQDGAGRLVQGAGDDRARPEFPMDRAVNAAGWTEVADTYRVPDDVVRALVELRLRWAPGGTVRWGRLATPCSTS